ncbi:MAG: TlpA family protein disulfide reductase [Holosporaceae bacterium]|nr:TlpA family protein disulfide reductase [Holosporaceae bacterium]
MKYIRYLSTVLALCCGSDVKGETREKSSQEKTGDKGDKRKTPKGLGKNRGEAELPSGTENGTEGLSFDVSMQKVGENKMFTVKDLKGNVVVILLITTWCQNCPGTLWTLDSLAKQLKEENIENVKVIVLNIGPELPQQIREYFIRHEIFTLDVYNSITADDFARTGLPGVPACLVYNKKNSLVWTQLGPFPCNDPNFFYAIKKLAQEKNS